MYKLAKFSVNYPTTVMMMVLAIMLLGYISFTRLGVDLLPDLNSPRLFVEVRAGERPPEEMEQQFVADLEAVAVRGRKVQNVSSISRVGRAVVTVEYSWDADMDEAFLDLQKSMADFSQSRGADEVVVSQLDPNAVPVLVVIFSHPEIDDLDQLRQTAENIIRNDLIRLPGVAAVEVIGDRRREIEVRTDPFVLEAYGLTQEEVAGSIRRSNRNMTGGSIVEMGRRYVIRGVGEFSSLDDLDNLIVSYKTPAVARNLGEEQSSERVPIYLREVADVSFTLSEPENIVRFNGRRCLALEVFKEAKFNTIDAAGAARVQLERLQKSLSGYDLEIIQDQSKFVQAAVTEVEQAGLVGIFLAVLILFVFLRRIGVTAIISIAIPISVVATFNLMYFNGLTLNIMTLGGLALGAGMLVDNAIVVMENVFRHLELGASVKDAAIKGAGEVGGAITSSTLTTIVVFLPIVYLHGAAGELFREQAWTVAYSLISSLFVSLAVIPMLCTRFLSNKKSRPISAGLHFKGYGRFLAATLKRRKLVVLSSLAIVVLTLMLIPLVGSEFMPQADTGELIVSLTLPEGTSLERTEGVVRNLEASISERYAGHVEQIYSRVGPSSSASDDQDILTDENSAVLHLILTDSADVSRLMSGLGRDLSDIPDAEARLSLQQTALKAMLGTTVAPLVVEIKGRDLNLLSELAEQVKSKLAEVSELTNVQTNIQEGRPEINLEIDRTVAARFSLSAEKIGADIKNILSGADAGQFEYQGEYADIVLRRDDISLQELGAVVIESPSGRRVRLDEVARLVPSVSPREIVRNNQLRVVNVSAHLNSDVPFDHVAAIARQAISSIDLPPDYAFEITGEEKLRREAFGNLKFALMLAIILVYMVMAAQFESLLHPFVILLSIPLAGVGAVLLLLILGMPFNIMSYIGIIMLAGIAVNDSIILVDRINRNRRSGMALEESIVEAGRTRIRPIIMTSVTTMLALLPLTIGLGEGASLRSPMAIAVIGGLFSSTALTLIVIPSVYHILARRAISGLTPEQ